MATSVYNESDSERKEADCNDAGQLRDKELGASAE
jgi:hypothetical protein